MTDDEWNGVFAGWIVRLSSASASEAEKQAAELCDRVRREAARCGVPTQDAMDRTLFELVLRLGGSSADVIRIEPTALAARTDEPPQPEEQPVPHHPPHQEDYLFNVAGIPCNPTPGRVAVGLLAVIYFVCKWGLGWNL
jgi:hypothetical protein